MKVLVLEDDSSVRRLIVLEIQAQGHTAVEASSIDEAIPLLEGASALVLDLRLPNGHGFDFLRKIAAKRNDLPTVVVSGFLKDRRKGPPLPISEWIEKPFHILDIRLGIAKICKAAAALEEMRHHSDRLHRLTNL